MGSNQDIDIRQSVSTRLLRVVFGIYLVIAIGVTVVHMVIEYRYQKNSISSDMQSIQRTFEQGLAGELWHLDQEAFLSTITGMLEIPTIVGVLVTNSDGKDVAAGGIVSLGGKKGNVGLHVNLLGVATGVVRIEPENRYKFDLFKHTFPIVYRYENSTKELGNVSIFSNTNVIFRRVKLQFLLIIVNALIKTAALWFIFLWFSNRFIRRPLSDLARATQKISLENLASSKIDIKRSKRDELMVLEESFNLMIDNLYESLLERQKADSEIKRRRAEFEAIIDAIDDAVVFVDNKRQIIQVNPAFTKIFGYELGEVQGLLSDFIYTRKKDFDEQGEKRYSEGASIIEPVYEMQYKRKDGSVFTGETLGAHVKGEFGDFIGFVGVVRDVTERKNREAEKDKLEEQLKQAYKMEAIGTLAGGIAHDFNNILFAIIGFSNLAIDKIPEDNPAREMIEKVLQGGYRARDLVKQILSFSRKSQQKRAPFQISSMIKEALKLLRATLPTTIEIKQNIRADCGVILADPTQIHQVIMNLCTNSKHAMAESGGVLSVALQNVSLSEEDLTHEPEKRPGSYLMLSVEDNGHGMTPEVMEHIFDPYFTTKDVDEGSGMGLAVVHGIVRNHGGFITVDSVPGEGTSFTVYFPVVSAATMQNIVQSTPLIHGSERILVVDDEMSIVEVMEQELKGLGYQVTSITNSAQALEVFKQKPDSFDLIITDQTMPNITGKELALEIMQVRPGMPVVLCTGYSEKVDAENIKEYGIAAFLMKPSTRNELGSVVRKVLDENNTKNDIANNAVRGSS